MTEQSIDKFTGLPQLPDGQYWNVHETYDRLGAGRSRVLRVEARKRVPCKSHLVEVSKTDYPTVREALCSRRVSSTPWWTPGGIEFTHTPNLGDSSVELANAKVTEIEVFKPKKLFRKPKLDHISYKYEADVLWDELEVLFYAETCDFSEEGILEAAERAVEDNDRKTAHERFVSRVSGDYPPKKLEIE